MVSYFFALFFSGGLIIALPREQAAAFCKDIEKQEGYQAWIIGIVEKGNRVGFGLDKEDNFIENRKTGDKMLLKPNGKGSYWMDVYVVGGGKTEITVDSGAEEDVCPREWGLPV